MRIGLVYDLRDEHLAGGLSEEQVAEFDTPATISELAGGLEGLGAEVERVGSGRALAAALAAGRRWDLVFSIAEGLSGRSREAQVPALCELFDQPYAFSDPLTMAATLDKAVAKRLVRDHGVPTAPFAVLRRPEDVARVDIPFPLFVKPIAEGTGKGCEAASRVGDRPSLRRAARRLIDRFDQPVIAEPFLPGREFTVGIVGNGALARVIGVAEVMVHGDDDRGIYSFANKELCESRVTYRLAEDAQAQDAARYALDAYRALECRDAARLDFRAAIDGTPQFLEANPIAGLHPSHSDLPIIATLAGHDYSWLLGEIVASAASRYGLRPVTERRRAGLSDAA